jgi:hypothetical protein
LQCWLVLCYTTLEHARHNSENEQRLKLANANEMYLLHVLPESYQSQLVLSDQVGCHDELESGILHGTFDSLSFEQVQKCCSFAACETSDGIDGGLIAPAAAGDYACIDLRQKA